MAKEWHGGKGSAPRKATDQKKFDDNWDKIFGNIRGVADEAVREEETPERPDPKRLGSDET